jgi:hypothetical protein
MARTTLLAGRTDEVEDRAKRPDLDKSYQSVSKLTAEPDPGGTHGAAYDGVPSSLGRDAEGMG